MLLSIGLLSGGRDGAFLLYLGANADSAPVIAFWSLVGGLILFLVTLFALQRDYRPGEDCVSAGEVPVDEWNLDRFLLNWLGTPGDHKAQQQSKRGEVRSGRTVRQQ